MAAASARASLRPYCEPIASPDRDPHAWSPLCPDVLYRTPNWKNPTTTAPPLALADSVRLAHDEMLKMYPEVKDWELVEVGLHPTLVENKWYYTVRWRSANWRAEAD